MKTVKDVLKELTPCKMILTRKHTKRLNANSSKLSKKIPLLLVDVSSIAYQVFYRLCAGSKCKLNEVGEVIENGVLKTILDLCVHFQSPYVVLLFDSRVSNREKIYPAYKEYRRTRKEDPAELKKKIAMKETLSSMYPALKERGLNCFKQKGIEADDLIAVLAKGLSFRSQPIIIVANDGDLYQLISPHVSVFNIRMQTLIGPKEFLGEHGYPCERVVAIKCLMGCASDNVKGVPKIGEKRAKDFVLGDTAYLPLVLSHKKLLKENLRLVSLPFEGTQIPRFQKFTFDQPAFKKLCNRMGVRSSVYEKVFCAK